MKLRVTIDTDECDMDRLEPYVLEVDNEGVASMWYGSHSYFVPFKDVEIISCKHNCGTRDVRNPEDKTYVPIIILRFTSIPKPCLRVCSMASHTSDVS